MKPFLTDASAVGPAWTFDMQSKVSSSGSIHKVDFAIVAFPFVPLGERLGLNVIHSAAC
jgi:hypothetical protein